MDGPSGGYIDLGEGGGNLTNFSNFVLRLHKF